MKPIASYILPALLAALCLAGAGCSGGGNKGDRDRISATLADLLIANQTIQSDSLGRAKLLDSVLKHHGYASRTDLLNDIRTGATNPDDLRTLLDSAQRRIGAVQSGAMK